MSGHLVEHRPLRLSFRCRTPQRRDAGFYDFAST